MFGFTYNEILSQQFLSPQPLFPHIIINSTFQLASDFVVYKNIVHDVILSIGF